MNSIVLDLLAAGTGEFKFTKGKFNHDFKLNNMSRVFKSMANDIDDSELHI